MRHGRGRYYYSNNEMYEGEWKNDKRYFFYFILITVYLSKSYKWQSNKLLNLIIIRHGYGILKDQNGEIYNGDWEFDVFNGQGRLRNKLCEQLNEEFDYNNFDKLKNYWVSYSGEFKNHTLHVMTKFVLIIN